MSESGDANKPSGVDDLRDVVDRLHDVPMPSDPVIAVPPEVLARYNARVLDPTTGSKVADQPAFRSTVYISDKLIVSGATTDRARGVLTRAATTHDLEFRPPVERAERREQLIAAARTAGRADAETMFHTMHSLVPLPGYSAVPDAWDVLQTYRAMIIADQTQPATDSGGERSDDFSGAAGAEATIDPRDHVGLDHLLGTSRHITSTPFDPTGRPRTAASGSYADPGWGGRAPVMWVGPYPQRRTNLPCRRPVVAVLDTGVGDHQWWDDLTPETSGVVVRNVTEGGAPIGLTDVASDPENFGVIDDELEGVLDTHSGHGTFIAGLIHQLCPDAVILSVRVTPSMGWVPEHVLLEALNALVCRQHRAQAGTPEEVGTPGDAIDILTLSLGYYDEQAEDPKSKPFLLGPIMELSRMGVLVVASAGNDATSRPMFPAAFAPYPHGHFTEPEPGCVPVTSVGATNPDGTTALFSNAGEWVICKRPGAALVSTFPRTFDASGEPAFRVRYGKDVRSTLDPDNFTAGFGTWSGTSFAAPVLAGQLAQLIVDGKCGSPDPVDKDSAVDRACTALRIAEEVERERLTREAERLRQVAEARARRR